MKLIALTDESFWQTVADSACLVVDFWSKGCMSCRMLQPLLEEAMDRFPSVAFTSVLVDDMPELAEEFHIMTLPTLLLFRNGRLAGQLVGLRSRAALTAALEELSQKSK